jgi:hypothetical protein
MASSPCRAAAVAARPVCLGEQPGGDEAAGGCEGGDDADCASEADEVGGDAGNERADRVAAVPPETIDAYRRCPPGRMGDVADGGEERWIDQVPRPRRTAAAAQGPAPEPPAKTARAPAWVSMPATMSGFRPIRSDSARGHELAGSPDGRVEGGDQADPADSQALGGEEHRQEAPGDTVVEVVHQPGLVHGQEIPVSQGGVGEDPADGKVLRRDPDLGGLVVGVAPGLADEQD